MSDKPSETYLCCSLGKIIIEIIANIMAGNTV